MITDTIFDKFILRLVKKGKTSVKRLFSVNSRTKQIDYSIEIHRRLDDLTERLAHYMSFSNKNRACVVNSEDELYELLRIQLTSRMSPQGLDLVNAYVRAAMYGPVLFTWNNDDNGFTTSIFRPKNVEELKENNIDLIDLTNTHQLPLYEIALELNWFKHYAFERIDPKVERNFATRISLNQDIVDYLLKLETIGANGELFNALVKRDDEWLTLFFKPLKEIFLQLKKANVNQDIRRLDQADNELEKLINWSSPKVKSLNDIMDSKPIELDTKELLDLSFYQKTQEPVKDTSDMDLFLNDDFAKDQANLNTLLNKITT